ncbi:MAG: DUF4276 family protein [Muribaculaceae bacterium]|nr:DUF4276 family protein [Muribaculaceae bacterium]
MSNIQLHILCEGETEQRFAKEVLGPWLRPEEIYVKPVVLNAFRGKGRTGGVSKFCKMEQDVAILLRQYRDKGADRHLFTTMIDYYAIPNDVPGYEESQGIQDARARVAFLEKEFGAYFDNPRLVPYIQLHEFEALLYTDILLLEEDYPKSINALRALKEDTDKIGDVEMINSGYDTAPCRRIIRAVEDDYRYNKVQTGAKVTNAIGMERLLENCRHFREWVESLQDTARRLR